jgi:hypothetical protein
MGRLKGAPFFAADHFAQSDVPIEEDSTMAMLAWRERDIAIHLNLESMRLLADFCRPGFQSMRPRPVDAAILLESIRSITAMLDQQTLEPAARRANIWQPGMVYMNRMIETHIRSYVGAGDEDGRKPAPLGPYACDWLGIISASHLYFQSVARIHGCEQPAIGRIILRTLAGLDRNLQMTEADVWAADGDADERTRGFWFWKAFLGAFTVGYNVRQGLFAAAEKRRVEALRASFFRAMKRWMTETEAMGWDDARAALRMVAWPAAYLTPGVSEAVWVEMLTGQ